MLLSVWGAMLLPQVVPMNDMLDRDIESRVQLDMEEALVAENGPELRELAEAHLDLLPRAFERVLEDALVGGCPPEHRWFELAEEVSEGHTLQAHLLFLRGRLDSPALVEGAREGASFARLARQAWDRGDLEAALAHRCSAATAFRSAGLLATAYLQERHVVDLLGEHLDRLPVMRAHCDALIAELEGTPFQLPRMELFFYLGLIEKSTHQEELATEHLRIALDSSRNRGDSLLRAKAADELGWRIYRQSWREGLELFREFEAVARARGDADLVARALRCQGGVMVQINHVDEGIELYREAIRIARENDFYWRAAQTSERLADKLIMLGRTEEAMEHLRETELLLELARGEPGIQVRTIDIASFRALDVRLRLHFETSDSPLPPEHVASLRAAMQRPGYGVGHRMKQYCALSLHELRSGNVEAAAEIAEQLVAMALEQGADYPRALGLFLVAQCRVEEARYEDALVAYETALPLHADEATSDSSLPAWEQLLLWKSHASLASEAVVIAADAYVASSGDPRWARTAVALMDFGRAKALRGAHGDRVLNPEDLGPGWMDECRVLDEWNAHARPDELLIAVDAGAGVIVAVHRGNLRLYSIPSSFDLSARIGFASHTLFEVSDAEAFRSHGEDLGRVLLGPVTDWLDESSSIAVLADGPLHRFPIDLLIRPDRALGSPVEFGCLPFLFRTHAVRSVVSPHRRGPWGSSFAGDEPTRVTVLAPGQSERRLDTEFAETEIAAIRTHFPDSLTVVRGPTASESWLSSQVGQEPDVLHLIVHGLSDTFDGRESAVLLAGDESADGTTTVEELAATGLAPPLVVVSGCQGGAGQDVGAEGVFSVGWGFLFNGSATVIVSPVDVRDRDAAIFWDAFYEHWRESGDAAVAMALARRALFASEEPDRKRAARVSFLVIEGVSSAERRPATAAGSPLKKACSEPKPSSSQGGG